MLNKLTLFLASGFGLGLYSPVAPGTVGSLPGFLLVFLICALPPYMQFPAALGFTLLAIPICDRAEKILQIKDDGRITADEWMLLPIAFLCLPVALLTWWQLLIMFAVVRFVDIVKPYPCKALQAIPGGRGIVIDDFVANLYSLAINWALFYFVFR